MFQRKLYNNYVFCVVYCFCVVCCLLCITVLCCANNQMHKMFQRKLYNNFVFCVVYCLLYCVLFVVLCIVCYVSQYCVVPTIKCKFFQHHLILCHKNIHNLLNVFSSVVGFSMAACSVWLMWPSLWWSCCVFGAVTPSFRWPE